MATGTVDFFNDTGGYGFIDTEDADEDVFFHMEDVGYATDDIPTAAGRVLRTAPGRRRGAIRPWYRRRG